MGAVQGSLTEMVRYGLPDDYFKNYPQRILKLTLDDLNKAAAKVIHPAGIQWVVVGDRASIEPKIRELGFAEIHLIDGDGNVTN